MEPSDPDLVDIFSPVPDETTISEGAKMFRMMLPTVVDEADLVRYHAMDAWMHAQEAMRKAQNKKLIETEKAWADHKSALKVDLEFLAKTGRGSTMLGTTYLRARYESVEWGDDAEFLAEMSALDIYDGSMEQCDERYVQYVPRITPEGRNFFAALILERAKAGLDIPACSAVVPETYSVCTRLKSKAAFHPKILMTLRNDALRQINRDRQDSQDSKETP